MLEYNEGSQNAKTLAVHYATRIGNHKLIAFMSGEDDLSGADEAAEIIQGFWEMTDFAIVDHNNDVVIDGIVDIEFWMHKLFNKVGGYMIKNGYKQLWDASVAER
ncbi:hypothetical protein P886_3748 [Alteromonadaceae bacterium 2753L.S.0a.02]|nr:hypothetical protein P886_3748 [Alteromonadaceae bacterium 2753L.S.0a.02]